MIFYPCMGRRTSLDGGRRLYASLIAIIDKHVGDEKYPRNGRDSGGV